MTKAIQWALEERVDGTAHTHGRDREPPASGKVTDDVMRSAALTLQSFDTEEILVVNHTDCGVMSASDEAVVSGPEAATGEMADVEPGPALPALPIADASIAEWVRMTDDIDEACVAQVSNLADHPLIPDVPASGYVYGVESGHLRRPSERTGDGISERL